MVSEKWMYVNEFQEFSTQTVLDSVSVVCVVKFQNDIKLQLNVTTLWIYSKHSIFFAFFLFSPFILATGCLFHTAFLSVWSFSNSIFWIFMKFTWNHKAVLENPHPTKWNAKLFGKLDCMGTSNGQWHWNWTSQTKIDRDW